jgi:PadR family transcriptional regulator PadR
MGRVGKQSKEKYYHLTAAGKRRLESEAEKWNRMADVIAGILGTTLEEI